MLECSYISHWVTNIPKNKKNHSDKNQNGFSFADTDFLVSTGRKGLIKIDPGNVILGKHENPRLCKPWYIYFYPLMKTYCFQRS